MRHPSPRSLPCKPTRGVRPSSAAALQGLTAARQLQRRGFDVTIYAMTVPPDTTSNMSTAGFTPYDRTDQQGSAHARVGRAVPARR
jgi:hypothetical protein